jgi:hypothetical protein
MFFLRCYPWYSLIFAFLAGVLIVLSIWLFLIRKAVRNLRKRGFPSALSSFGDDGKETL